MSSPAAVPVSTGGSRQIAAPKKGIGAFVLIGIGIVVVLIGGATVFGLTRDSAAVDEAVRQVPLLNETSDGWVTIEDLDGGFTAAMPPGNTADTAVPGAGDASSSSWTADIGDETTITVGFTQVTPVPDDDTGQETLEAFADSLVASLPDASLDDLSETGFAGFPAALVEIRYANSDLSSKVLLIKKGDRIYSLDSTSVYPDHPSYDRMAEGFAFTQ